jgi:hypothetical protein
MGWFGTGNPWTHSLNRQRGHGFRWLVDNKHPDVTRCADLGHVSECAARDLTDMMMAAVSWSRPSLVASSCDLLCETSGCTVKEFSAQGVWEEWAQSYVSDALFGRPPEKLTFSMLHACSGCFLGKRMHPKNQNASISIWGSPGSRFRTAFPRIPALSGAKQGGPGLRSICACPTGPVARPMECPQIHLAFLFAERWPPTSAACEPPGAK